MSIRNNAVADAVAVAAIITAATKPVICKFTPEDYAVMRHVWNLSRQYQQMLNKYFLRKTTIDDLLLSKLDTNHTFKDYIVVEDIFYEVEYMECSFQYLHDNCVGNKSLIISFRRNVSNHLAVAIVRLMRREMSGAFEKVIPL